MYHTHRHTDTHIHACMHAYTCTHTHYQFTITSKGFASQVIRLSNYAHVQASICLVFMAICASVMDKGAITTTLTCVRVHQTVI